MKSGYVLAKQQDSGIGHALSTQQAEILQNMHLFEFVWDFGHSTEDRILFAIEILREFKLGAKLFIESDHPFSEQEIAYFVAPHPLAAGRLPKIKQTTGGIGFVRPAGHRHRLQL